MTFKRGDIIRRVAPVTAVHLRRTGLEQGGKYRVESMHGQDPTFGVVKVIVKNEIIACAANAFELVLPYLNKNTKTI